MGKRNWLIELEGVEHDIELEHGYFSGKRIISADDEIIEHTRYNLFDAGSKHEFEINGHSCIILITPAGFKFSYDLIVDGISVKTGLPAETGDIHFAKPSEFLPQIIGICIAGSAFSYFSRYGKSFIPAFLLSALIYLTVYFGSEAIIRRIKK